MRDLLFGTTFSVLFLNRRNDDSRRRKFFGLIRTPLERPRQVMQGPPQFAGFRTCVVPSCSCYTRSCCAPPVLRFPGYRRYRPTKLKLSNANNRSPKRRLPASRREPRRLRRLGLGPDRTHRRHRAKFTAQVPLVFARGI